MKKIAIFTLSVVCLCPFNLSAAEAVKINPYTGKLSSVAPAELPAKSAELVKAAKNRDREATTISVVKAALGLNPAAAAPIVGAIARTVPDMAAVAAGTAAAEQPKQASAIAKAAAAAAPGKAGKIVAAVCAAVPNDYRAIAIAVAEAVPTSGKEILKAVEAAVPALRPYIEKELATYGLSVPPVGDTLALATAAQGKADAGNAALLGAKGSGGPAVIPPSNPNPNGPPNTSGNTPPGGRNYSRP
jgi:hypothetical protein